MARKHSRHLPSWIRERPCAHRGLHDLKAGIPENAISAFEAALEADYAIELDVQILGDGTLVVFHDDNLVRATGIDRSLMQCTRQSVSQLGVFGTDQRIPLLSEVLTLVRGRVPILLEIKHRGTTTQIAAAIHAALDAYQGALAVQSFNPYVLRWFRQHAPSYARGQLGGPLHDDPIVPFEKFASRSLLTMALSRPDFINFDLRALPDRWVNLVAAATRSPVLGWTVRTDADHQKALSLGVNYVFEGIRP